ncbi:YgiQ family radical SAM protein [candidate division KSB1 bacterium]|nr:YgiQ family radical SAM protein [candidate division KSB1 bacterium]
MFLPTTSEEIKNLGWEKLDIILITGDTYIDSPYFGIAVVGKVLLKAGFKVGVIAQPDVHSDLDITRLGEPALFWGVTGGSVDSMVANYTATKKRRKSDDYTPGGQNNRRPDRAVIVYSNLIRTYFKNTRPIVLGGIEASLRRIAHYDYWSDSIRRSIIFDAKADILVYGMAEKALLELAECLKQGANYQHLRGICYIAKEKIEATHIEMPSFQQVITDKNAFIDMFHLFYQNNDPITAKGLLQQHDNRYLVQNPPALLLSEHELDAIYDIKYENNIHPFYQKMGDVRALETIRFSITTHRGCYGECNFCAIAVHQGRTVQWRSEKSILKEAQRITELPGFKGYILDVGGPTANMYGFECQKKLEHGVCTHKRCIFPEICPQLRANHQKQIQLLRKLRQIKGIKKVFVASGIRYDLLLHDDQYGKSYLQEIVNHHVSGQLKVAPEHSESHVLNLMGKSDFDNLLEFKKLFDQYSAAVDKKQFLTYYLIAAHPGCTEVDMQKLKNRVSRLLKINPEQVQIFTPTPSTYSSLMYYTEMDPFSRKRIFVEKSLSKKEAQKENVTDKKIYKTRK